MGDQVYQIREEAQKVKLNDYQDAFIFGDSKFHFLTSAWGTGKSYALIIAGLEESRTPHNLGVIFRKEYTDLRDSTCVDFEQFSGLQISSKRDVSFSNKSKILFRHVEELNNIQNMNLGWFGIEQAEELDTDREFFTLFGRLRRKGCSLKGYIIANAKGHNWIYKLKTSGIHEPKTGLRLDDHQGAQTFDNAHNLSPEFLSTLEVLKVQKPQMYNRFVLNSDEDEDTVDIIIKASDVRRAVGREPKKYESKIRRAVWIDPARYGDDETVLYAFENRKMIGAEYYNLKDTMQTAGYAQIMAKKYGCNTIGGDVIGLGAGVFDRIREIGAFKVREINSSGQARDPKRHKNIRSEMWCMAGDAFARDEACIIQDDQMIDQLSMVRYKTVESSGCLLVEPKADIKKRLGRSPDRADCCVMGLAYTMDCEPVEVRDRYQIKKPNSGRFNSETC